MNVHKSRGKIFGRKEKPKEKIFRRRTKCRYKQPYAGEESAE